MKFRAQPGESCGRLGNAKYQSFIKPFIKTPKPVKIFHNTGWLERRKRYSTAGPSLFNFKCMPL